MSVGQCLQLRGPKHMLHQHLSSSPLPQGLRQQHDGSTQAHQLLQNQKQQLEQMLQAALNQSWQQLKLSWLLLMLLVKVQEQGLMLQA